MDTTQLAYCLPESSSPSLQLTNPTPQEQEQIWALNFKAWGGALSQQDYLSREQYLMTVPLAQNGGVTHWILVENTAAPNQRRIFGSCETLSKPTIVCDKSGNITDMVSHGVGSVFCDPQYRGKGYAARMMKELGERLRSHQSSEKKTICSVLWSDIGKAYYAKLGWTVFPSFHTEFPPTSPARSDAQPLSSSDLAELCAIDEAQIRLAMASAKDGKFQVAIVPNNDHMQWHHMREDYLCEKIFGKKPTIKGAIIGEPGHRIWAIWTRNFYGPINPESGNVLTILRLVIEDESAASKFPTEIADASLDRSATSRQETMLKAVIQVAQSEATDWKMNHVELWNPTPLASDILAKTGLKYSNVERDTESIPSLFWYGEGTGGEDDIEWLGNEKYGWC